MEIERCTKWKVDCLVRLLLPAAGRPNLDGAKARVQTRGESVEKIAHDVDISLMKHAPPRSATKSVPCLVKRASIDSDEPAIVQRCCPLCALCNVRPDTVGGPHQLSLDRTASNGEQHSRDGPPVAPKGDTLPIAQMLLAPLWKEDVVVVSVRCPERIPRIIPHYHPSFCPFPVFVPLFTFDIDSCCLGDPFKVMLNGEGQLRAGIGIGNRLAMHGSFRPGIQRRQPWLRDCLSTRHFPLPTSPPASVAMHGIGRCRGQ